jgi:DegV family protein with EDD domain
MGQRIRFVTDSTCDIPADIADKHGIIVVPVFINYQDQSIADDGIQLHRDEYYKKLPTMLPHPSTSAMSPGIAEEAILRAAQDADHVIIITLAAQLSGVYNAMRLAAQKLPEARYTLIDAGNTSMALGWQVLIGAETNEKTGGDLEKVIAAIHAVRDHLKLYCALETMEYLRRSGRVSWAQANIGALLQIKPIIEVDHGDVKSIGRVRTFKRALEDLEERIRAEAPLAKLAILHSDNLTDAKKLGEMVKDIAPADMMYVFIAPAIGTNIGPGGVGVALVKETWRNEPDHAIGT